MSGWERTRRRYRLVHDFARDFASDSTSALAGWKTAIEAEYGDLDQFLRDVQRRCFAAVDARLDSVLEAGPADPSASVVAIFAEVNRIYPELVRILEEYAGHPALAEGNARFRRSVLSTTGVDPAALLPRGSHPHPHEEGPCDERESACTAAV